MSSSKIVDQYVLDHYLESMPGHPHRGMWVFDFDDTLVVTESVTIVTKPDGQQIKLTPQQLTTYDRHPDDVMDYRQFELLVSPREVTWMTYILHSVRTRRGNEAVAVLSARSTQDPIREFLAMIGVHDVEIVALGTTQPSAKSTWINDRITVDELQFIEFFDDSRRNVDAVAALQTVHPNVVIRARHIDHTDVTSLHKD